MEGLRWRTVHFICLGDTQTLSCRLGVHLVLWFPFDQ
uniref:Uncharacterized protein n=1 Tax=Anguilla anguilla TaxID=7936 RepID=A0A0E9VTY6_ANGAN